MPSRKPYDLEGDARRRAAALFSVTRWKRWEKPTYGLFTYNEGLSGPGRYVQGVGMLGRAFFRSEKEAHERRLTLPADVQARTKITRETFEIEA